MGFAGAADFLGRRTRLVGLSTKGMRSVANFVPPNWVNRLWPMVSAVMPVPSET